MYRDTPRAHWGVPWPKYLCVQVLRARYLSACTPGAQAGHVSPPGIACYCLLLPAIACCLMMMIIIAITHLALPGWLRLDRITTYRLCHSTLVTLSVRTTLAYPGKTLYHGPVCGTTVHRHGPALKHLPASTRRPSPPAQSPIPPHDANRNHHRVMLTYYHWYNTTLPRQYYHYHEETRRQDHLISPSVNLREPSRSLPESSHRRPDICWYCP